jgi:hypothetical protein
MVAKITEIDVLCRDGSDDPVVVRVFLPKPGVVLLTDDEAAEALGFSYLPGITKLSEIIAHGWVKPEKNPIPNYQGRGLPAWKLVRK